MRLGENFPPNSDTHDARHYRRPSEALLDAAAQCEAVGFEEVLVIYNTKDGKSGSFDSGLTASESGFLCDLFKAWLVNGCIGVLQGELAEAVRKAILEQGEEGDGKRRR